MYTQTKLKLTSNFQCQSVEQARQKRDKICLQGFRRERGTKTACGSHQDQDTL